ncbi:uncharacterized protein KY384_000856 [Bacidia gigantensis]|uniref:uncharacterized protein n=1 Tax=Bacidia gigantensis TaxID=2732470 RepID=UPI001D04CEE8|nr:uncharacterized protein KY384_000856 [Bacidia gigantensis]KAG8534014.1 hypothetical protein KY384_000856 [Bacidia gigantensis]
MALSLHGLDYGRYQNSQPRAPVLYGWHGFRWMITCRYFLVALGVIATIAYKFAIVQVSVAVVEPLTLSQVKLSVPSPNGIDNGTTSPLLSDSPSGRENRGFVHLGVTSVRTGPDQIIMVGLATCDDVFRTLDSGTLVTRELVMVADRVDPEGDYFMKSDHTGWQRDRAASENKDSEWVPGDVGAIVDFAIQDAGSIAIPWAPIFSAWDECGSFTSKDCDPTPHKVISRLNYSMTYAIAEVRRTVAVGSCSIFSDDSKAIELLATSPQKIQTENSDGSISLYRNWVDAIIYKQDSTPSEGVSAFVRAVMIGWAVQSPDSAPEFGHAAGQPLGREDSGRRLNSELPYPYFIGVRANLSSGGYIGVAVVFIIIACLSLLVLGWRLLKGAPRLTSWMAQHVSLNHRGDGAVLANGQDGLATGYDLAPVDTVFVKLEPKEVLHDAHVEKQQIFHIMIAGHARQTSPQEAVL